MTAEPPSPPRAPSWTRPIVIGALLAALLPLVPNLLMSLLPGLSVLACCCCGAQLLPVGGVPAAIALRRDPFLTPGQGFAVSFIGSGLGYVATAALAVAVMLSNGGPAARETIHRTIEEYAAQAPDQSLTAEQIDRWTDSLMSAIPFIPVVMAAVMTVLAAFVGLVTVLVLRRPPRQPS